MERQFSNNVRIKSRFNWWKEVYAVPLISDTERKGERSLRSFENFGDRKVGNHPSSLIWQLLVLSFDAITRFSWNTLRDIDLLVVDEFICILVSTQSGPTMECAITRSKED